MKTMDALLEQPLARAAILGERGAGLSRRPGQILSAVILLCVVLNIGQTWLDFRENEQVTAARLDAGVRLLDSTISERFAVTRNVLGQMDAIVDAVDDGGALSADGLRQLKSVGVGLSALMPGSELAIIAPDGAILGETGSPVYNAVPDLRAMLARPQRPSGSMLLPGRHGQVLAVLKPHWNRHGAVTATLFLMAPHTIMRDWASRLAMMPHTEALTLDAGGMLLSEYPGKGVVAPGQRLPLNGQPVAGYESVAYIESPRDGLSRMVALRRISPPWSGGADYWVVQYGHATGDYRQGWLRSTVLNLIISVALLVLLAYYLAAERRNRIAAARAAQALRLVRKVLDTMPAPMALVDRADGSIGIGNARLLERFGAVASQGDPIVRLFMHAADWATLTAAGMADAVPMLGRHGMFLALAHCQALTVEAHGVQRYWLLSLVDVTGQQNRLAQLQDEAMRDPLTGLFNRRGFGEQAAPMAADAIRHNRPLALLALVTCAV